MSTASQYCAFAVLRLLFVGNSKLLHLRGLQWYEFYTTYCETQLTCSELNKCMLVVSLLLFIEEMNVK
jgi:hypothetical protein